LADIGAFFAFRQGAWYEDGSLVGIELLLEYSFAAFWGDS
jgi:hypothetical protein